MSASTGATNRVEAIFAEARASGRKLLMPFVCAGSPSLESSMAAIEAVERGGGSIVEVGIPFSDPIADGPVIAAAMHDALERGVTPEAIFDAVAERRSRVALGLVAMVSVSIVHRMGIERFVSRAAAAGFDGFIFPDAPLEEAAELGAAATGAGLTSTLLVAPGTSPDRAAHIAEACSGFIYVLTRGGITGEQAGGPSAHLAERIAALRAVTDLPLAAGFGISSPEQVREAVVSADAAIVGSALVRRLSEADEHPGEVARVAEAFTGELAAGLGQT
ncbi:MAG: tryptophan synthase subunit alpha [Planctomycetota bacterium]